MNSGPSPCTPPLQCAVRYRSSEPPNRLGSGLERHVNSWGFCENTLPGSHAEGLVAASEGNGRKWLGSVKTQNGARLSGRCYSFPVV